jgi:hypothetical protein
MCGQLEGANFIDKASWGSSRTAVRELSLLRNNYRIGLS